MSSPPILRLLVVKGPRSGQTLACDPTAGVLLVGRIIKGNAFAVRDRGASESHLAFQFLADQRRWAVSDLATSNGTIVNDALIAPSVPFPLSHGDVIKIGSSTSIMTQIGGAMADEEDEDAGRRGTGRVTRSKGCSIAVEDGDGGEAAGSNVGRGVRRVTRSKAASSVAQEAKDEALEVEMDRGRGRRRKPATRAAGVRALVENDEAKEPVASVIVSGLDVVEKGDEVAIDGHCDNDELEVCSVGGEEEENERGGEAIDMDKMTLEEWFDRMEKVLPQMITDVAEEMMGNLREKARRFEEFIATSVDDN